MSIYIKILDDDGAAVSVEELVNPVYVCTQESNGLIVRCIEPKAQGVLDATGEKIYQLLGKKALERTAATVEIITLMEYDELNAAQGGAETDDTEDTDPVVPEGDEEPMTRAELTAAVATIQTDLADLSAAIEKGLSL